MSSAALSGAFNEFISLSALDEKIDKLQKEKEEKKKEKKPQVKFQPTVEDGQESEGAFSGDELSSDEDSHLAQVGSKLPRAPGKQPRPRRRPPPRPIPLSHNNIEFEDETDSDPEVLQLERRINQEKQKKRNVIHQARAWGAPEAIGTDSPVPPVPYSNTPDTLGADSPYDVHSPYDESWPTSPLPPISAMAHSDLAREIIVHETATWEVLKHHGRDLLPFLAPDCVMIFPASPVVFTAYSTPSLKDILNSGEFKPWVKYEMSDVHVLPLGTSDMVESIDAASISYCVDAWRAGVPKVKMLITSIWRRVAGEWRMVLHQQTSV